MKKIVVKDRKDLESFYNETENSYIFGEDVREITFEDNKEWPILNASIFAPNADITINYDFQIYGNIQSKSLEVLGEIICHGEIHVSYLNALVDIKAKEIFANKVIAGRVAAEKIIADSLYTDRLIYVDDIKIRDLEVGDLWDEEHCNDIRKVVSLSW